jgi:hypothetical protein
MCLAAKDVLDIVLALMDALLHPIEIIIEFPFVSAVKTISTATVQI